MRLVWFVQFLQSTKQGRPVTRVWHSVFCLSYESGTQHTSRRWQRLVQHELQSTCLVITPAWSLVFIFLIELVQKATLPKEHLGYITTLQRLNTKMSLFLIKTLGLQFKVVVIFLMTWIYAALHNCLWLWFSDCNGFYLYHPSHFW